MSRPTSDSSGYLSGGTIVAPATAPGGAIAIVRVSGIDTARILGHLTGGKFSMLQAQPRSLVRHLIVDSKGATIDDALVAWFPGPNSYTGEDSAEIHLHGGAWIVARSVSEIHALGARHALPGEFSFRAVRNGKMTLSQAEAVADLIASENEVAAALALEKMSGSQSALMSSLAEELRNLATSGEVGIDFADQDVEEVGLPALRRRASEVLNKLRRLRETYSRGTKIQSGVRTALMGLPNAGKSSFFNALLGEDRAIVSEIAGTTRDVIRERVTLTGTRGTVTLRLEDTAGLRDSTDPIERIGVERTKQAGRGAELVLMVVEASAMPAQIRELTKETENSIRSTATRFAIITKRDLATAEQAESVRKILDDGGWRQSVLTSALTGEGILEAGRNIADICETMTHREVGEVLLTRESHAIAADQAMIHLERALLAPAIELFAADLRQTLAALAPLFGETPPDAILTRIFSTFCIGK